MILAWIVKRRYAELSRKGLEALSIVAGMDLELVNGVFETTRISCGLLAFHSAFLHHIARPPGIAIDKVLQMLLQCNTGLTNAGIQYSRPDKPLSLDFRRFF